MPGEWNSPTAPLRGALWRGASACYENVTAWESSNRGAHGGGRAKWGPWLFLLSFFGETVAILGPGTGGEWLRNNDLLKVGWNRLIETLYRRRLQGQSAT